MRPTFKKYSSKSVQPFGLDASHKNFRTFKQTNKQTNKHTHKQTNKNRNEQKRSSVKRIMMYSLSSLTHPKTNTKSGKRQKIDSCFFPTRKDVGLLSTSRRVAKRLLPFSYPKRCTEDIATGSKKAKRQLPFCYPKRCTEDIFPGRKKAGSP